MKILHKLSPLGIAGAAFAVFVIHSLLFKEWLIDDAGIMFAYARNIAGGFGIVAQPGLTPVEGCSDFLWVMLFVPFFWLNIFDPVITTKIFSGLIILGLYVYCAYKLKEYLPQALLFIFLIFLSVTTPFVIWNTSGLENPLYIFLIVLLFYYTLKVVENKHRKNFIIAGIIAFLVAITRPDGILFLAVLPATSLIGFLICYEKSTFKNIFTNLVIYAVIAGGLLTVFLLFRYSYFGEWVPNTYFSKGGPGKEEIVDILMLRIGAIVKIENLFSGVAGKFSMLFLFFILVLNAWIFIAKRFNLFHLIVFVFFVFSIADFLLLPYDWMGEFRFATPFVFFFFLLLISTLYLLLERVKYRLLITSGLLVVIMIPMGQDYYTRSNRFAANPTVPFYVVANWVAYTYNDFTDKLEIKNPSLLAPDCGATLFYGKFRVFDMAGLIDKRYALTTVGRDRKKFNHLVFEVDKPTFINIHSVWARTTQLQADPRFRRDYTPVTEVAIDSVGKEIIATGHYVRKDAIKNDTLLENLRKQYVLR